MKIVGTPRPQWSAHGGGGTGLSCYLIYHARDEKFDCDKEQNYVSLTSDDIIVCAAIINTTH